MRFGAHNLPTCVPELDGSVHRFYQSMFEQMEEMERRCIDAIHRWRDQVGLTALSGTFHFGG